MISNTNTMHIYLSNNMEAIITLLKATIIAVFIFILKMTMNLKEMNNLQ